MKEFTALYSVCVCVWWICLGGGASVRLAHSDLSSMDPLGCSLASPPDNRKYDEHHNGQPHIEQGWPTTRRRRSGDLGPDDLHLGHLEDAKQPMGGQFALLFVHLVADCLQHRGALCLHTAEKSHT